MPSVSTILAAKGGDIHFISPSATVLEATKKMDHHKIGALVVMHEGGRVVGIFTERDVLRRVVAEERNPRETIVSSVMTHGVICCTPETDLDEVSQIMKTRRIRHTPVCDNQGNLLGMISIGDVNAYNANNQEATIHFLNEYIYGRV